MLIPRWKSRRRSFSPFARLSAEISSARYKCIRIRAREVADSPCEATDFWDYSGSRSFAARLSGAAVQLLIARLSVSSLKQLNFARECAIGQIARGDEKNISCAERDIISFVIRVLAIRHPDPLLLLN